MADDIRDAEIPGVEAVVPMVFEQVRMIESAAMDGYNAGRLGADRHADDIKSRKTRKPLQDREINRRTVAFWPTASSSATCCTKRHAAGIDDEQAGSLATYADRVIGLLSVRRTSNRQRNGR